jgi:hypothetical protein
LPGRDGVGGRRVARFHPAQHLAGERQVRERALRLRLELERRHAVRGRLGEPHVARDHRAEQLVAEVLLELGRDVLRERVARVVHRAQQALDLEPRIEVRAHLLEGLQQVRQAFERVILALHRDEHRIGGAQSVQRQEAERRRAVEQDEVVVGSDFRDRRLHLPERVGERVLEPRLPLRQVDELDLGAGQVAIRRHEVEPGRGRRDAHVGDLLLAEQHLVDRVLQRALVDAGAGGRVALRIEVHDEHAALHRDEAGGEVHRRRRLADPALLVGDREDARHPRSATRNSTRWRAASSPGTWIDGAPTIEASAGSCAISSCG